jgi:hypothetical protein
MILFQKSFFQGQIFQDHPLLKRKKKSNGHQKKKENAPTRGNATGIHQKDSK